MIWDACTFVGEWPFASLPYRTVADLLARLQAAGIARALVSPLAGAFHPDPASANAELAAGLAGHADRLHLVAACNPAWPGWERALGEAVRLGAVGVRLFPGYHGYQLSHPEVAALASRAGELGLPVFVTLRLQDERQHPAAFQVPSVPAAAVAALARAHPGTRFVLSMARFAEISAALPLAPNLYADLAGVQGPDGCLDRLVAELGSERLLFGSEALLQYPLPARMKLEYSDLGAADRERIGFGNLEQMGLPLTPPSPPAAGGRGRGAAEMGAARGDDPAGPRKG